MPPATTEATEVRQAQAADRSLLLPLLIETDAYYVEGRDDPAKAEASCDLLLSGSDHLGALIAIQGGAGLGYASFARLVPGDAHGGTLFLKDLFVSNKARGQGVGQLLMSALAGWAIQNGLRRLDWTANAGDNQSITFYERLGARPTPEKIYFRADLDALSEMAHGKR